MEGSYDKHAAVVVLPAVARLEDRFLRRWLAQSNLSVTSERRELLRSILAELGIEYPQQGLGALRMWGQTGDRPTVWIAAADPVFLEPRLDHLRLHALSGSSVSPMELRVLIDHLQDSITAGTGFGFARLGARCYLRSDKPIATATVPAYIVDGRQPGEFLPVGSNAAAYRNLQGEIEMALHDHESNQKRIADGRQPVNSLWLWGGGVAPERATRTLPPLFATNPLLHGFWESCNAPADRWPGHIEECLQTVDGGFVAVTPASHDDAPFIADCLQHLRDALRSGRVDRLVLLFRDGRRASVRRSHALRFWRRSFRLADST